jgi:hypothetical protein
MNGHPVGQIAAGENPIDLTLPLESPAPGGAGHGECHAGRVERDRIRAGQCGERRQVVGGGGDSQRVRSGILPESYSSPSVDRDHVRPDDQRVHLDGARLGCERQVYRLQAHTADATSRVDVTTERDQAGAVADCIEDEVGFQPAIGIRSAGPSSQAFQAQGAVGVELNGFVGSAGPFGHQLAVGPFQAQVATQRSAIQVQPNVTSTEISLVDA